jgi:hypothetical protein
LGQVNYTFSPTGLQAPYIFLAALPLNSQWWLTSADVTIFYFTDLHYALDVGIVGNISHSFFAVGLEGGLKISPS